MIRKRALILGAIHVVLAPTIALAQAPATEAWLGHWTGVGREDKGAFHRAYPVDFEIIASSNGLALIDHDRQRISTDPIPVIISGRTLTAQYSRLFGGKLALSAKLSSDGTILTYTLKGEGMTALETQGARLRRDDPDARIYLAPRVDAEGRRVLDYHYRPPKARDDGILVSTAEAEGVDPAALEAMVRKILAEPQDVARQHTESVLVLRNGKLIFEEYFWGQSTENPHMISSVTKSVTSMLTGLAWDRGKLDLDQPVTKWFPDRPSTRWSVESYPITIRQILSMNSGTEWNDSVASGVPSAQLLESDNVVSYVLDKPLIHLPGSHYNYDNGLPSLAGVVLARAMKEPIERFADRLLFRPLGISNYRWTYLREGTPLTAGGLYLTSRAMAKLGQTMLDGGTWQGKRVLSQAWVTESTRTQSAADDYPYGFYWHLTNEQQRHIERFNGYNGIGQGGQLITVLPSEKIVIVATSSSWKPGKVARDDHPFTLINRFIGPAIKPAARKAARP